MLFKQLFHGQDTNIQEDGKITIFHNRRFPKDENYNFIVINESIEDFDLFNLIKEEQDQTQAPLRIIQKNGANEDLLSSLNFEIERYTLYANRTLKLSKQSDDVLIKEADNLENYQNYRTSYTPKEVEAKLFEAKKTQIVVAELDGQIVGSILLHQRKDFLEIDDFYVLETKRKCGVGSALLNYAKSQGQTLVVLTDADQPYLKHGFKEQESVLVATHY